MTAESHEVAADVAETVAPDSVENTTDNGHTEILSRLDDIQSLLTQALDTTTEHAPAPTADESGDVEEPGNNEVIRDKSPASKPWTHKRILK